MPEFQPIPSIQVDHDARARFDVTVGADGSVQSVTLLDSIPGEAPRLMAAMRSWRFKPATDNSVPVPSHVTVDISFKRNE